MYIRYQPMKHNYYKKFAFSIFPLIMSCDMQILDK